ncbi:hypothetical protein AK830_g7059 [Neonectria ditissima]|uniref:Uncharacterized protein n=1 Tax=Neonectria ditissima TaxID=78410 RepID=A0A0P7AY15_9HYPO|nr:hypothetical protein AK830_g7059 [Neonectria ditissima]
MNGSETKILVIVLATVVPVAFIAITVVLCRRSRQRRFLFLKRGITPIDDEEIESWRTDRSDEKTPIIEPLPFRDEEPFQDHQDYQQHQRQQSSVSIRKPPSVIIYQNGVSRASEELARHSMKHKRSMDVPATPVLARAPNSRPGLTDETIQGDDAFIPSLKRQPSRLAKLPPTVCRQGRSSTMSVVGHHDPWHGHHPDKHTLTRMSSDYLPRANRSLDLRRQKRVHSISTPPRMSFDDEVFFGGLSPRPLIHKSEIGRAIG